MERKLKEKTYKEIRVSAKSPVPQLAASIVISLDNGDDIELRACGASAVNQAVKAVAAARGTLASRGYDLYMKPGFDEVEEEDGVKKTIIIIHLLVL